MTEPLLRALALVHVVAQCGLLFYGLHRLSMLVSWLRQRARPAPSARCLDEDAPCVTVQLPVFDERFVAGRLIDAVARLDWPRDRFEIQVLDDSTDDTRQIVDAHAAHWRSEGIDVRVIRRATRQGYKAGALADGLRVAKGEFVALFDADFLPEPDFLRRTLGPFSDPRVGMVQARWGFVNAEQSWLTRAQSVSLDAHFRIEHQVRFARGLFFNFNGTAGVWRRRAIEEAGGWRADTVTEDLDLSYRAQLAGWRFFYLDDVVVPSELPVTLASLRVQQRRWAKGSIQTARRILPRVWRAALPFEIKLEATAHLLGNLGWLLGAIVLATLYPAIVFHTGRDWRQLVSLDLPLFLGSSGVLLAYFACASRARDKRGSWRAALLLPVLSVSMAPVVSAAILSGLFTGGGTFERTPKFGILGRGRLPALAFLYQRDRAGWGSVASLTTLATNVTLLLAGVVPLALAIAQRSWAAVPFLLLTSAAFVVGVLDRRTVSRIDSTLLE